MLFCGCGVLHAAIGRTSRRSCFGEISKDEIRALAVAGGVQGRSGKNWRPLAELREGLEKILAPAREVGCVKSGS